MLDSDSQSVGQYFSGFFSGLATSALGRVLNAESRAYFSPLKSAFLIALLADGENRKTFAIETAIGMVSEGTS